MFGKLDKALVALAASLFVFSGFVFSAVATAEFIPPETLKVSTPVYQPQFSEFAPPLGTYTYTVSWQGIPAATVKFQLEQDGIHFRSTATARTYSGIDLLYKLRYKAEGLISAIDFLPVRTKIDHRENSRVKETEIEFLKDGSVRSVHKRKGRETIERSFNPDNLMLGPLSAGFLARSLEWELGETKEFDTYNGNSRYLISFTAEDYTSMKVNGVERPVWVISPKVKKLTDSNPKEKLRRAWIYVTADSKREILQIKSEVFIGSVKTKLVSYEPSTEPVAGQKVAVDRAARKVFLK